jgi:hypothetical protein
VEKLVDTGLWEGRVMAINPKSKNRQWANVSWMSDSGSQSMRVDVFGIMDVPVATFLKVGDENHLWLFLESKHYYSQDGRKLFQQLTRLPIDPVVFFELLGPMRVQDAVGGDWTCFRQDGQHQCQSKSLRTRLQVENRELDQRKIQIVQGQASLQVRLVRSKVEVNPKAFLPLNLSQFKTIRL